MRKTIALIIASVLLINCQPTRKAIKELQPRFLTNYTINPAPNGLDSVGIIFSVDAKGATTTLGNLNLPINSDSITVPMEVSALEISYKFLLDFLAIKNLDSATNMSVRDSVKVNTDFRVNDGLLTRFDPSTDLNASFMAKRKTIASNISFLGLQKNKLFLIVEAIKSTQVNLSNITSSKFDFNADGKFKQLLHLNPAARISNLKNNSLVYTSNKPRVVFYKLRQIDIDNTKGPEGNGLLLTLGNDITTIALY
jgi:hypothetical protein